MFDLWPRERLFCEREKLLAQMREYEQKHMSIAWHQAFRELQSIDSILELNP